VKLPSSAGEVQLFRNGPENEEAVVEHRGILGKQWSNRKGPAADASQERLVVALARPRSQ